MTICIKMLKFVRYSKYFNPNTSNFFATILKKNNTTSMNCNFCIVARALNQYIMPDFKNKFKYHKTSYTGNKLLYCVTIAGLLKFFGLPEEAEDSELMQVLKRGELSYMRGELDKSEKLFHLALRIAQELLNENAETFIYDRLANIALEAKEYEKSRKLFIELMNRLFQKGIKEDDLVIIHISFKLAKIFENLKDYFGAHNGYDFCFKKLEPKLREGNEEYEDARILYKTILNGYAYFNYSLGKLDVALDYFKKTLDVTREIHGEQHEDVVLTLNNLGTIYKHKNDMNSAIDYFHQAEKIGKSLPEMNNFSYIYLNLAYCYMETNLLVEANKYCELALQNAIKHEYEEGIKEADECIKKIQTLRQV